MRKRRRADRSHQPAPTRPRPSPSRGLIFGLLCAACVLIVGGYAALAARRSPVAAGGAPVTIATDAGSIAAIRAGSHIAFRSTAPDDTFGKLGLASLDAPSTRRAITGLQCDRVHVTAGWGLCLVADRNVFTEDFAAILDAELQTSHTVPISGIPSRTRLSPDGRFGAMTVFVEGHSYAEGGFSTATTIHETTSGAALANLEEFAVWREGARFQAADFNFWGVTFTRGGDRFYATLASAGKTYLVEGSLVDRQARVIREGVECPSLSPDETRVAFKKRVDGGSGSIQWRPHVLDLATLVETSLAETRNVDDQIEWLDDGRVLYGLPDEAPGAISNVWALPADGSGAPRLFLAQASSPAVAR